MGVRGLSTFFNQNPDFFKPHKLHDSRVIIDGDNLLHRLYFNNKVSSMYGGDYKKYADAVRKYLLAFLECNVNPIIIFDGGIDKSGRKLKTIQQRAQDRLTQVIHSHHIAQSGCYERILPILAHDVFLSVLVEIGIIFAVCDYEADDQITALANYYKCPVISADSDFYIYDVHEGFINLDSVNTTISRDVDSDGREYNYLSCSLYHINEFVSCFPGIDKTVLPLFGTLIGNDYVEGKEFNNFFSNIQLPKYSGRKLILNSNQRKMMGLLCWLKNNTLNEAVSHVMQYLKKDKREYVKSVIEDAVSGYQLDFCNLTHIIDEKLYNLKQELCLTSRLTTPCGNPLPLDFILKYHMGQYSSFFINVIALHKVFLLPQIEDIKLPSSYECARNVRKVIYGILTQHNVGNNICENEKCLAPIEENERQGKRFQKQMVEPTFSLEDIGTLPKVDELNNLKKEKCLLILAEVLDVDSDFFLNFPDEWQLLFGCINYWLCNSKPRCTESFIYALIINLIYFSIIKYNCFEKHQFECSNKKSTDVHCTCSSVMCVISNISELEIQSAVKKCKKFTSKPTVNHGNPLLIHILHSYSQLQSCVISIKNLNKLLGEHMKNPAPHRYFTGTMLYNLTKDISTRSNIKLFVAEILGRETNLHLLFKVLLSKIYQNFPSDYFAKSELPHKKPKRKSAKNCDPSNRNSKSAFKSFDVLNRKEVL